MNENKLKPGLAIVIGIDQYTDIPKLKNAVNDAKALADVLKNNYNYEVLLLLNQRATKAELDRLVTNLKKRTIQFDNKPLQVNKSDRVLFYFAGHGFAEEAQESEAGKPAGYFMPQDAEANNKNTWLSMQQLYEAFSALDSHHLLMILDCCFAGRISWVGQGRNAVRSRKLYRQSYDRFIKYRTEQIITSAAHDEEAQDLSRFGQRGEKNGNSPFAHLLLKVLQGNSDGGKDKFIEAIVEDKVITVHELFTYLQNKLGEVAEGQTPGLSQPRKYDRETGEYVYLKGEYIFPFQGFAAENLKQLKLNRHSNPYKGLASFDPKDSDLFFGRKTLSQQLGEIVGGQPLTIVLGASGSGKSSLVKAGLIPLLKTASFGQKWHILNPMRPGESPLKALNKILAQSESGSSIIDQTAEEQVKILLGKISYLINRNSEFKLLLIIDQTEELLTLSRNQEARENFLNLLAELLTKHPQRLHIVLTLRSDFEPQLRDAIKEPHWQEAWQKGRFFVTPMNREELQQAIEEPAAQRTLFFESPKLVNQLIDEAIDTPGALPLLSFTLSELYLKYLQAEENRQRDDRTITEADYEKLGGVASSLTQTADKTYQELVEKEKINPSIIRNVMLRMVSISSGELARRRVPTSELIYPESINEQVQKVIDRFLEARLLVTGLDIENQKYVEPAHDALVRGWQQLLIWKQEKEESLMLQRRLTSAAEEWNNINSREQSVNVQAKIEPVIDWLDRRLCTVEKLFNQINTQLVRLLQRSPHQQEQLIVKPKQFLWNSNPYLDVLEKQLESNKNWFNQIEAEFVQQSVVQKRRNISWRWRIAIGVILGLSGLFLIAMIFLGLSRINQAQVLRKSAEINLQENQSLDGMIESLEAANILDHQGLQLLLLIENLLSKTDLREQVRGTLLRAVYTVREIDRQTENQGKGTVRTSFSLDGNLLASAGEDCDVPIRVWDLQDQTLSKSKPFEFKDKPYKSDNFYHPQTQTCEPVKIAHFRPKSQLLAAAGANGTVGVWNVRREDKKLTKLKIWNTNQGEVKSISFSPDGKLMAATGANGTVLVWNLDNLSEKPESLCVFNSCDKHDVWSVAFSPDSKRLASTGDDDTISLWDREGNKNKWNKNIKYHFDIHREKGEDKIEKDVTSVSFSRDGNKLVTAGKDGIVRVWDLSDRKLDKKPEEEITTNQIKIWDVSFSSNAKKLATAGEDETVRLWDLNKLELGSPQNSEKIVDWEKLEGHRGPVRSVSFSPNGQELASAGDDGSVRLWKLQVNESEKVAVPMDASTDKQKVEIHDGNQSAYGNKYGTVEWQKSSNPKDTITMQSSHVGAVTSLAFIPDSNQLASGGEDGTIRLWNDKGEQKYLLPTYAKVNYLAYSQDQKLLASAGDDGMVQLWNLQDLQEGEPFAAWKAYHSSVTKVSFSLDGKVLVLITAGKDSNKDSTTGLCKLWPIESFDKLMKQADKKVQGDLEKNSQISDRHLCDGIGMPEQTQKISTGETTPVPTPSSPNKQAEVQPIELKAAKEISELKGHQGSVRSVAFSPNGQKLATTGDDGTIRLWNAQGQPLSEFKGNQTAIRSINFSPDGQKLVSDAIDSLTAELVPLFHPRQQQWSEHFVWSADGTRIEELTVIGRATVVALGMNHSVIIAARRRWVSSGWHPPIEI